MALRSKAEAKALSSISWLLTSEQIKNYYFIDSSLVIIVNIRLNWNRYPLKESLINV